MDRLKWNPRSIVKLVLLTSLLSSGAGFAAAQDDERLYFGEPGSLITGRIVDVDKLDSPSCTLPPKPENGNYDMIGEKASPGDKVQQATLLVYNCNDKYDLMVQNSPFRGVVVCLNDGKWSHDIICKKTNGKITSSITDSCVLPEQPENGNYDIIGPSTSVTPGERVSTFTQIAYSCKSGYTHVGKSFVVCRKDGSWSEPIGCESDNAPPSPTTSKPTTLDTRTTGEFDQCALPAYPENGKYKVGNQEMPPGARVNPFTIVIYTCNPGFGLHGPNNIYCEEDGKWSEEVQCVKFCDPLQSLTVDFKCLYRGEFIDCDKALPDGTTVTTVCKGYHVPTLERNLKLLSCKNGVWDELPPRCRPDCGQIVEGAGNVLGGITAIVGGSPWHVGVYSLDENGVFSQICGGTIISRKIVISAAHCFDTGGVIQSEQNYAVAAGKYYRVWENEIDNKATYKQISDIEAIRIPKKYGGHKFSLQQDLAVLILKSPFDFHNMVHAICIDILNQGFNELQLASGNVGKVVGWGVTEAGNAGSASTYLKLAEVPVVEYDKCIDGVPEEFKKYVTPDKFCAGFLDRGTTVCSGDSGGGMVFKTTEKGVTRWYIRGIVSAGALDYSRTTCLPNSYTIFTSIFSQKDFLSKLINKYEI
ncbi:modular serine protease-like [Arctopsyche grandis]|uniref:modular serine protease-like n=1 Tax=Arctopsyche grandis TaxID=121162 RepID=UPI00406D9A2D